MIVILALVLSLVGAGRAYAGVANPLPEFGPIVVFGDSLAKGYGANDPQSKLDACLNRHFKGYTTTIYAALGATTTDALKWVDGLLQQNPKAVVISLGGNDVLQFGVERIPTQTTFDNLRVIYRELVSRGIMVIHLGLNPPLFYARRLGQIKTVAESEGVLFVPDILDNMWTDPRYMSDMIHPNDAGYQIVCQRVSSAVKPYLRQPEQTSTAKSMAISPRPF